jgi:hypothetical protein
MRFSTGMIQPITQQELGRYNQWGHTVGFYLPNFLMGLVLMSLLYPVVKAFFIPLASLVVPISHGSLGKTLFIYTIGYWLPLLWRAYKQR